MFSRIKGDWCLYEWINISNEFVDYCIIGNDKESLSDLIPEAWDVLGIIEKEIESICKKLFGATMFNLMKLK